MFEIEGNKVKYWSHTFCTKVSNLQKNNLTYNYPVLAI